MSEHQIQKLENAVFQPVTPGRLWRQLGVSQELSLEDGRVVASAVLLTTRPAHNAFLGHRG